MNTAQRTFDRSVSYDFHQASLEDVKEVALAIWHVNFVPVVDHLSGKSALAAGYVIDKLMRFNCVSQELKSKLREVLSELKFFVNVTLVNVKGCDKLAQKWGL
jgi:hypothetical protein